MRPLGGLVLALQGPAAVFGQVQWEVDLSDAAAEELVERTLTEPDLRTALGRYLLQSPEAAGQRGPRFMVPALASAVRVYGETESWDDDLVARQLVAWSHSIHEPLSVMARSAAERVLLRRGLLGDVAGVERFAGAWQRAGGAATEVRLLHARWLLALPVASTPDDLSSRLDSLCAEVDQLAARQAGTEAALLRGRTRYLRALLALRGLELSNPLDSQEQARGRASLEEQLAAAAQELNALVLRGSARRAHSLRAALALVRLLADLRTRPASELVLTAPLLESAADFVNASLQAEHASLDTVCEASDGAYSVLYDAGPLMDRAADARLEVAAVLRVLAPNEVLGARELRVPADLSERVQALRAVRRAHLLRAARKQIEELERQAAYTVLAVQEREEQSLEADLELRRLLDRMEWRHGDLTTALASAPNETGLEELRTPAWLTLEAARAAREQGQSELARAVLVALRTSLDADPRTRNWLWGIELLAAVESTLGSTLSDVGDARAAQAELLTSVERLAELLTLLETRGDAPRMLQAIQNQQSSVYVALAVNANVKLGAPLEALEWFEKAWQLRKDDTMRVLGACYRARAGLASEARSLLQGVVPSSLVYYNLACAHALLGEADQALEYLRLELSDPRAAAGAVERRKQWAREDPDLKSLRGDARFQTLVGP